jgi:hypothetical protein
MAILLRDVAMVGAARFNENSDTIGHPQLV